MPDEEMDMTVDFGHSGFGEDIDIDLDFPAGQPDEDMDLGDFDRSNDIQILSSDTRDEMMAEGDDSSYGMMDAIEIDRNTSAAAGNDIIDIELEHVAEGIWENQPHSADFNPDTEINYLDDTTAQAVEAEKDDIESRMWLPLEVANTHDADTMSHVDELPLDIAPGESETREHLLMEELPHAHGEPIGPLTASRDGESPSPPEIAASKENRQSKDVEHFAEDEIVEVMAQISDKHSVAERDEPNGGQQHGEADIRSGSANFEPEESYGQLSTQYPDEIAGIVPDHADQSHNSHEFDRLEYPDETNSIDVKDDHAHALQREEADQSADALQAEEADQSADALQLEEADQSADALQLEEADQSADALLTEEADQSADALLTEEADQSADAVQHEEADHPADDASEDQKRAERYTESINDQTGAHDDSSEYQLGAERYIESANDQTGALDAPQAEPYVIGHNSQSVASSPERDLEGDAVVGADSESLALEVSDRDDPIALAEHYGVYISYGKTDYNLFATGEDDDPNEYFLGDKSALDVPLTQFLGSLREIISDEISPLDELVMHVDGLGLEFSESTTLDFLGKFTFGDLVILYDKLVKNELAESPPPIYIYLTMKPSCNRRMMALGDSANAGRGLSEVGLYRASPSIDDWQGSDVGSLHSDISIGGDYNDGENNDNYIQEDDTQQGDIQEDDEEGGLLGDSEQNPTQVDAETQLALARRPEQTDELDHKNDDDFQGNAVSTVDNEQDVSVSKPDDPTLESSFQLQETSERSQRPSPNLPETGESEFAVPTTSMNPSTDVPNSDNTSVTATLDGEDHDEIDYSDEDDESNHDEIADPNSQEWPTKTMVAVEVSVDEEITWESDNDEENKEETNDGSPTDAVQVLLVSEKRGRSFSDAFDDAGNENDHKRRRS